jgi:hypothetical protein
MTTPLNVAAPVRDRASQEVLGQDHTKDPQESTGRVEEGELTVSHPRSAGHNRRERSDNRYETRDDDCLPAVLSCEEGGTKVIRAFIS